MKKSMITFQSKVRFYMDLKSLLSNKKEIDILSNLPDGVMLVNPVGEIEWCNDKVADLFKCDKTFLARIDVNELIESGFDLIKQTALSNQSAVGKVKAENAKNMYFEITSLNVQNSYVVCLRDITQNYKTVTNLMIEKKSAKKNNSDKNNFLVKLSNEYKSPLQSIQRFSQAMIDGLGGEMTEKQDKYIKIINKNSSEALYFINKVIELAKTESNLFEYDSQIFDIVNCSQIVAKEFELEALEKNIEFNFDTSDITKKSIFSDEGAIKVILKNILEVCLSMTDLGSISVKLCHPERDLVAQHGYEVPEEEEEFNKKSYILFTVTDTGAGYSELEQEDLFEPYLQLDKPNKKNILRSITLASVRNLVKHLKGEMWLETELMNGTTYNVIIPVAR